MHLASEEIAVLLYSDPSRALEALRAAASLRLFDDHEDAELSPPASDPPRPPLREEGEILLHLVACPRCRRRLSEVLLTPASPEEVFHSPALLEITSALEAEVTRFRRQEQNAALPLLEELLRIPAQDRLEALQEDQTAFRHAGIAELLVDRAQEAMPQDLADARHLAFLATAILEALPETPRHSRLLAMAYCTVADVERRRGVLDASDELLANAVRQLAGDELLHRSRARFCLILGYQRRDQGRIDEALALFERARRIAEELGADDEQAQASLALGWLLLDEFEGDGSLEPLWEAYNLLDASRLEDVLSAVHGLLIACHAAGDPDAVPELLTVLEGLRDLLPPSLGEIRVLRVLAQLDAARGDHVRAEVGFGTVFRRLASGGYPLDAAAAALELARHVLERNYSSNQESLSSLLSQLREVELPPHVEPVVHFAISFAQRLKGYYLEALASAEIWLQRARVNPSLPYLPLAEPLLLVSWNQMSAAKRLQAADAAGVELSSSHSRIERPEPLNLSGRRLLAWTHEALTGQRIVFPEGRRQEDDTQVNSPGVP